MHQINAMLHLCDVRTTERPSLMTLRMQSHRKRRALGSIPVVGSSCNEQKAFSQFHPGASFRNELSGSARKQVSCGSVWFQRSDEMKRGGKKTHGFLGSSITKLFPIVIIKTSREGIFLELWSNLCRRPLNLLSAAESYISSALQRRILTRPMFTWWEHKHEAHTSAARHTLTHLSHSLLLFPRGLSVHAWLDIDSTRSTGWLRSTPGSILASRIPQIPRTFPSPCPMCPRANSMWRCLKAAWAHWARAQWRNWHGELTTQGPPLTWNEG